jgi:hypothetical protein
MSLAAPITVLSIATSVMPIARKIAYAAQITLDLVLFVNNTINARNATKTIAIVQIRVRLKPAFT